jgi:cation diffusion facilitator family transporter
MRGKERTVSEVYKSPAAGTHTHVFLASDHARSERQTWAVIALCTAMMIVEIVGGHLFGSIALVADGWHMSTHAGALLLAALAYTLARRRANDPRFTFGTGKFGDLAGFSSAIILGMIAAYIGFESVSRVFAPLPISFGVAIPIAVLGLIVNIASAWLLSAGGHDHSHGHSHGHSQASNHGHSEEVHRIDTPDGALTVEIFEAGVPPRFRVRGAGRWLPDAASLKVETARPGGAKQTFAMRIEPGLLESVDVIPEPHEFILNMSIGSQIYEVKFEEPSASGRVFDAKMGRDNNMRAAIVHVVADAAVSLMVILGLIAANTLHWLWIDPLAGLIGALVIASWSLGLLRDTGAILLDMCPDNDLRQQIRAIVEAHGDQVLDLHLWRLGPGHLGAIVSILARSNHSPDDYRRILSNLPSVSHLTIEINPSRDGDAERAAA